MRSARDRVLEPRMQARRILGYKGMVGGDGIEPPFGRAEQGAADWNGPSRRSRDRRLRGLPLCDDLPEVRCQLAIVMSKHLIEGPLGPVSRLPDPLLALGGFALVQISHHRTTPRNTHNPR
jgi:hypothetical protein